MLTGVSLTNVSKATLGREGQRNDTGRSIRSLQPGLVRRVLRGLLARCAIRAGGAAAVLRLLAPDTQQSLNPYTDTFNAETDIWNEMSVSI
jgi:hypothetical protein